MASSHLLTLLSLLSLINILTITTSSSSSFRPSSLVLPVSKDASTLQYTTILQQRTPLVPLKLVLDLGGQFLWVDCDTDYVSTTYSPSRCGSAQCSLARSNACTTACYSAPRPGCHNDTCGLFPDNTITNTASSGDLGSDAVSVSSTNGSTAGRSVTVQKFLFACAPAFLTKGLSSGSKGMAGLGRSNIGLPAQFSSAFSFPKKFAICIPFSTRFNGVVFFGPAQYTFGPFVTISTSSLSYTPLLTNPVSTAGVYSKGDKSTEYFIGVRSIAIDGVPVAVNTTRLKIDGKGNGGTKISTVQPYTVMEDSIFRAVTSAFASAAAKRNITRVKSVAPFEVCFDERSVPSTRLGAGVPRVELEVEGQRVVWEIEGGNSMVEVPGGRLCLGFVNGGVGTRTAVVIGGAQLEDNLLEFDLEKGKLGFSGFLAGRMTTCANFGITA